MKLSQHQLAPAFHAIDIWGEPFALPNSNGKATLLMFFRYAECPLCNFRVAELERAAAQFKSQNLEVIGVFQSPPKSLKEKIENRHSFSFRIIADEERKLYDLFGVNPSWLRSLSFLGWKSNLQLLRAWKLGFKPGKIEGKFNQIPADFLIDRENKIQVAHYGKGVTDHLPISKILAFSESL